MSPRTSQLRPTLVTTCEGCGAPILYSDRDPDEYPFQNRWWRPVDPIALTREGMIAATILNRRLHTISIDRNARRPRIFITTHYRPLPPEGRARIGSSWSTPASRIELGIAPSHRCGTSLPGEPMNLPAQEPLDFGSPDDQPPF